ncbi:hypothetical protein KUTeg_023090, partial [Tegillarca granosa]
ETWVNVHHGRNYQWYGNGNNCSRIPPFGKGQRLIFYMQGHQNMDFKITVIWFLGLKLTQLISMMKCVLLYSWNVKPVSLIEKSVMVLDNANYHSLRVPGTESSTSSWKKCDIASWLTKMNITYPQKSNFTRLLRENRLPIEYLTDKIAKENGHKVIRTPVRHFILNAIEHIWSKTLKKIIPGAYSNVTLTNWDKAVEHAIERK